MTSEKHNKSLMRCLGEFVGHIVHAVKSSRATSEVNRTIEEKVDGKVTLRRTTIDEIEIRAEEATRD
ncbi:MAG: hypothetical protein HOK75_02915 [Phycisphaerae bacterium]|jgi:hypothetical protein|nr:hypothetical protein [Phycisphaerae bacterium]MBT5409197.1 hypothetical protein [Phycisphaerae bacterium]MBT6164633.1 hypothetical protein [Phycisphaerae bacterium]MBT7658319.1 hypothetical protein [Phycisphaerae bacterium]|tara:strand:+ start:7216 stop:7416 length:201 start_codon:yes stop_codon:yes gene_type:complete